MGLSERARLYLSWWCFIYNITSGGSFWEYQPKSTFNVRKCGVGDTETTKVGWEMEGGGVCWHGNSTWPDRGPGKEWY